MNTKSFKNNKNGFTLIELLLVIVIIGILSAVTLSVINIPGIRAKTRDSQRIADLKKIQTALELYFADNRSYPASSSWRIMSSSVLPSTYLDNIPTDPNGNSAVFSSCSTASFGYSYRTIGSGAYVLVANMEVDSSSYQKCSSVSNCSSVGCGSCSGKCYAVQNPF